MGEQIHDRWIMKKTKRVVMERRRCWEGRGVKN